MDSKQFVLMAAAHGQSSAKRVSFIVDWTIDDIYALSGHDDLTVLSPKVSCQDLGLEGAAGTFSLQLTPKWYQDGYRVSHGMGIKFQLLASAMLPYPVDADCTITFPRNRTELVFDHGFDSCDGTETIVSDKYGFILHKHLFEQGKKYLPEDDDDCSLTVHAEIQLTCVHPVTTGTVTRFPSRKNSLADDYAALRLQQPGIDCSDFVFFSSGGQEFPVHRAVLVARCPVFAAMLAHETVEKRTGRCTIADLEDATLDALLDFIYSGATTKVPDTAENLLAAAEKYLLALKDKCETCLMDHISVENAARLFHLADVHDAGHLRAALLRSPHAPRK